MIIIHTHTQFCTVYDSILVVHLYTVKFIEIHEHKDISEYFKRGG